MKPFTVHTGIVAPLNRVNVDTDQVIPKQFLTGTARTGYDKGLFFDWRVLPNGEPNPDFVLNRPEYQGASILVAGRNFGCGSSREHAPWALRDWGFRSVIAPSYADIFYSNSLKNGLVVVTLPEEEVQVLLYRAETQPGYQLTVDLEQQEVRDAQGFSAKFELDPFRRYCILNGLDDIGVSLQHEAKIRAYEEQIPWYRQLTNA